MITGIVLKSAPCRSNTNKNDEMKAIHPPFLFSKVLVYSLIFVTIKIFLGINKYGLDIAFRPPFSTNHKEYF